MGSGEPGGAAALADRLWRIGLQLAYRAQLLWWRVRRPRIFGAYVAVWHGGRVLAIRNSYRRRLSFPAGRLGRGEAPLDAALRELREEVGIEAPPEALRYVDEFVDEGPAEDHAHVFELHCDERPLFRVDRREVVWADFLTPADLLERGAVSVVRAYLARSP
jgi:8-oxo-dGTP diphosphatase